MSRRSRDDPEPNEGQPTPTLHKALDLTITLCVLVRILAEVTNSPAAIHIAAELLGVGLQMTVALMRCGSR